MRSLEKNLSFVLALLRAKAKRGVLKPETLEAAERHVRELRHAFRVRDLKAIEKAVGAIARLFLAE